MGFYSLVGIMAPRKVLQSCQQWDSPVDNGMTEQIKKQPVKTPLPEQIGNVCRPLILEGIVRPFSVKSNTTVIRNAAHMSEHGGQGIGIGHRLRRMEGGFRPAR